MSMAWHSQEEETNLEHCLINIKKNAVYYDKTQATKQQLNSEKRW